MLTKLARIPIKYPTNSVRILCTAKERLNNEKNAVSINFKPIYKFPYIRVFSVINKLKLYQTFLAVTSTPISIILNQMDIASSDTILVTLVFGITGCMVFYSLGYLSEKFIGFVYLSEDNNTVKVSSVDFWGNRKDEVMPLDDVVPLSDLPVSFTDGVFVKFCRYSRKDVLKLSLRFGVVLDKGGFNKVFK